MCVRKGESLKINDVIVHLKRLEKEEKIKPKEIRRKRHIHQKQRLLKHFQRFWVLFVPLKLKDDRALELERALRSSSNEVVKNPTFYEVKFETQRSEGIQYFLNS